jgi:hypothetical protein
MEVLSVEGIYGPLKNLVVSAWKQDETTYRIILDSPKSGKFIVVTVDLSGVIREAVTVN